MSQLSARIEAVLFVSGEPLSTARLAELTGETIKDVETAFTDLSEQLADRGIRLSQHHDGYRLNTAPEADAVVRAYLQDESHTDLTKAALETLAIIAYRGPISKSGVEEIRSVASDTMLRNLMQRGLIVESGRSEEAGRPMLYSVSHSFLHHFGLGSLHDLPPLPESEEPREN